ncbi:hypothetical protein RT21_19295 [Pseudomonas sp. 10B238]|uniref:hypothetical protein n=1 Tax=Pseudomonadaceae TaxID=135621 RepID=UPI00061826F4|nr:MULTISPECIES: hypothetical protein [Pseudomonadaceae]MAL34647.1 hypothetical protein [Pseudomonas sp.]KJJ61617.1 hypothetical protein RT21_19295 [Pseudomonas sp. 10B238]MBK3795217.1 hypothetical protein [Stutzerimonas stutzeri]MBK3878430.1 hypothetical protein [Stutzerimonas stutzeri]HBM09601.1 hypothetical protein [Pseudomonas sp.]
MHITTFTACDTIAATLRCATISTHCDQTQLTVNGFAHDIDLTSVPTIPPVLTCLASISWAST